MESRLLWSSQICFAGVVLFFLSSGNDYQKEVTVHQHWLKDGHWPVHGLLLEGYYYLLLYRSYGDEELVLRLIVYIVNHGRSINRSLVHAPGSVTSN